MRLFLECRPFLRAEAILQCLINNQRTETAWLEATEPAIGPRGAYVASAIRCRMLVGHVAHFYTDR